MAETPDSYNPDDRPEGSENAPGDAARPDASSQPGGGNEDPLSDALSSAQTSLDEIKEEVSASDEAPQAPRPQSGEQTGIELLSDVDLDVSIELGRTEMLVEDVLKLGSGSVVELDKLAGDPVDVHVNGRLVARGEVLVLNDNFCIRISEIVANLEEEAEDLELELRAASAGGSGQR